MKTKEHASQDKPQQLELLQVVPSQDRPVPEGQKRQGKLAVKATWLAFTHFIALQEVLLLTTVAGLGGLALAVLHHAGADAYIIIAEWIVFLGILIAARQKNQQRIPLPQEPAPLCHIIFVSQDYTATTEYYQTNLSAGRILADALDRARKAGACSVTYYEGTQQFHIPLTPQPAE